MKLYKKNSMFDYALFLMENDEPIDSVIEFLVNNNEINVLSKLFKEPKYITNIKHLNKTVFLKLIEVLDEKTKWNIVLNQNHLLNTFDEIVSKLNPIYLKFEELNISYTDRPQVRCFLEYVIDFKIDTDEKQKFFKNALMFELYNLDTPIYFFVPKEGTMKEAYVKYIINYINNLLNCGLFLDKEEMEKDLIMVCKLKEIRKDISSEILEKINL